MPVSATLSRFTDNYFNGGVRHKPAYDVALDRYVQKYMSYSPALTDIVRYEYTEWKKIRSPQDREEQFDRGAVRFIKH